jgi:hypothetical protein
MASDPDAAAGWAHTWERSRRELTDGAAELRAQDSLTDEEAEPTHP